MAHRFYVGRKLVSWMAAFAFALSLLPLSACGAPPFYKAAPIEGWVVEADTGKPLEGVIVVAKWQLEGGFEGNTPVGQLMVMESVTDKQGKFYFEGWGPKLRPGFGKLKTASPELLFYKKDYEFQRLVNRLTRASLRGELKIPLRSDWNGKQIPLKKFDGSLAAYEEHLGSLSNDLSFAYDGEDCDWKRIPKMLVAQHLESLRFQNGITHPNSGAVLGLDRIRDDTRCGRPIEFFKEYLSVKGSPE